VKSINYLDTLENFVYPQLLELQCAMFFQQDVEPQDWSMIVGVPLNQHFLNQ
jgi:hypothetical protein